MSLQELEIVTDADEKKRKKQFRFSPADDERLLTQVVALFPFGLGHGKKMEGWKNVAAALNSIGMSVDHRRCQDRTSILIENFRKTEAASRKLSGVEEKFTEVDRLLSELVEMVDNIECTNAEISEKKMKKAKEAEEAGERIRSAALEEFGSKRRHDADSNSTDGSNNDCKEERKRPRLKKKKSNTEDLQESIEESNQKMFDLWSQDQDLRREELKLQQRRLDMEEKDREKNQSLVLALTQALLKKLGE